MKDPKILVVGSVNQDIIYYDIIERHINGGSVYQHYRTANGGKGANQVAALASLGAKASLVGCVGRDTYGYSQINVLKSLDVNTEFIRVYEDIETGLSVMFVNEDGTYYGSNVRGANGRLTPELVSNALASADFDMVIMQLEMPLETVYRTYELAAEKNIPVIFDPGPAKYISLERFRHIFIITPNEDEAHALTDINVETEDHALSAAKRLYVDIDPKYVVLKLGKRGAYLYDGKDGKLFPAFPIKAVDSTGAGDTFTAELAIRLCLGDSIEIAIRYANAAGAICVSRYGAQPSIPTAKEVDDFFENIKNQEQKSDKKQDLNL